MKYVTYSSLLVLVVPVLCFLALAEHATHVVANEQCGDKWCNDPLPNCCNPNCGTCVGAGDPIVCDQTENCDEQPGFGSLGCFPGTSTVQVQVLPVEGKSTSTSTSNVFMRDLKVGDMVFVGYSESDGDGTGRPLFGPIYAFGHVESTKIEDFFRITVTASPSPNSSLNSTDFSLSIELTREHLVFSSAADSNSKEPMAVRADSLRVGDTLLFPSPTQGRNVATIITSIQTVKRTGLYQPLTREGVLVVDGLYVSAYVSIRSKAPRVVDALVLQGLISEHALFHAWMTPCRLQSQWCAQQLEKEGILPWLVFGRQLANFGQQSMPLLLLLPVMLLAGITLRAFSGYGVFWSFVGMAVCFLYSSIVFRHPWSGEAKSTTPTVTTKRIKQQ